MGNQKMTLQELMDATKVRLKELNYADSTIYGYSHYWQDLLNYASEKQTEYFTVELGENYLWERCHVDVTAEEQAPDLPVWKINVPKRAIYLLADFQSSGTVFRKSKGNYTPIPNCFTGVAEHFYATCRCRYNGEGTIKRKSFTVKRFLLHLEQKGVKSIGLISEWDITSFLKTTSAWTPRTVATTACNLRQFLRFLYQEKYTSKDLSKAVPTVSYCREGQLPNLWKPDDVKRMLESVDRANPVGKRDYAILLMVTQLGLRDSDIQNLRFENLLWKECRIRLIQTNTKHPLEFPMNEDVRNAIIDYMKYGRPKQDTSDYVFVRHCAPYGKCSNYYHIMRKHLRTAGVPFDNDKPHGLHTLRHTLATRLLEQEIPLQTISEILGHSRVDSTKAYLQMDIEGLRKCAMNPDEVCADADD